MSPLMKKANNKDIKQEVDKHRNKDNLWFIKNWLNYNIVCNSNTYNNSILNHMYNVIDLDELQEFNINMDNEKKYDSFKNLIYRETNKKNEKNKLKKKSNIFILDNSTDMVYKNDKYYGYYVLKYLEKGHKDYDNTKLIKAFHIYDKNQNHKYIFYPQICKYKKISSVFEEYENITKNETYNFAKAIDTELEEIKEKIKELTLEGMKQYNNETYKIKRSLLIIIQKICNSNLDLSENMYNFMNEYLLKTKEKTEQDNDINNENENKNLHVDISVV